MLSGVDGADDIALRAGTDLALAAGAFGQSVTLVFAGDAVRLLRPQVVGEDPLWRLIGSLPYYDIDSVYTLEAGNTCDTWRDDLSIVAMSPTEWHSAALQADIVMHY